MTVTENDRNRANVEGEANVSTEMEDLEAMLSGSQSVLMQEPLVEELQTHVLNVVNHSLA